MTNDRRRVGAYRLTIDGAMIVSMVVLIWHVAGWTREVEKSIAGLDTNYAAMERKFAAIQETIPDPDALPISRESDRRLTAVEVTIKNQYDSLEKRLVRIEQKLDGLN